VVITLMANLFVTKGNVAQIVHLKEIIHMNINPKEKTEEKILEIPTKIGKDIDDYDDIEIEDGSEIGYEIEYTTQY